MNDVKPIEFIVPAGTVVKMNGIPVEIKQDTIMSCNPFNLTLALDLVKHPVPAQSAVTIWPGPVVQPEYGSTYKITTTTGCGQVGQPLSDETKHYEKK